MNPKDMGEPRIWYTAEDVQVSLTNTPQITLELTDDCNLKCEYCGYGKFYGNHDRRENNTLKFDYVRRFLDYLYGLWQSPFNKSAYNRLTISFYGGEPLLNMSLIREIVDFIEQSDYRNFRDICFNMTTNAMLLDQYMDYLVEKDIQLLISLDGDKDNMSYRINHAGENVFDRIVAHVDFTVDSNDLSIYELDEEHGSIKLLGDYDGLPSDENYLNEYLGKSNDLFVKLLKLEDQCK
jgi:uncharacterized protein